ncbi:hypothetical protein ACIRVK_21495 [Streptomyces sp. NPDC101152]|uniref:hypothetical protein n=1 Tax=Streptomyces sp. NPDC101152 TaxID=3366116 RepID=UPI003806EE4A
MAADVQDDLRSLLNAWDPIGVADLVHDEYDCLIVPILSRLRCGADRVELGEFPLREMTGHFGLSHPHDADAMANRLTTWWTSTYSREP